MDFLVTALSYGLMGFLSLLVGVYIGGEYRERKIRKMLSGDIPPERLSTTDGVYIAKVKLWMRDGRVDDFALIHQTTEGPWSF